MKHLFQTSRATFFVTTSDCKPAASTSNNQNGSCEADEKEKVKHLSDTAISYNNKTTHSLGWLNPYIGEEQINSATFGMMAGSFELSMELAQ